MEKKQPQTEEKSSGLVTDLTANLRLIRSIFDRDETLITRSIESPLDPSLQYEIIYCDGMVNNKLINEDVIKPLLEFRPKKRNCDLLDVIAKQVTLSNSVERTRDMDDILQAIIYGDTVFLADGYDEALVLNTKGWSTRSLSEPENERVLRGPREGFNESLLVNLSLLRRRLRTPKLKMEFEIFGVQTNTKGCICYLDDVVNTNVLNELKKRLSTFTIDGTLDVNYLAEFIRDSPFSIVETVGSTEKPDVVAAKLLEGRVALFLDGTPVVLTMPHLLIEHFQSDEDYFLNFYFASISRVLRVLAFFVATGVPAMYVAITTFHQEILPTSLLMSISLSRQGVPFPTVLECALMLGVFELLREASTRMPGPMGQALSIVGALVMGQAAVEAKLVSAPMIIVVAITGICGLMLPRIKGATIILRFLLLGFSAIIGLYGYLFGMLGVLIHLFRISSFGVPIMTSSYDNSLQDKKDIAIRAPWWMMKKRPEFLSPNRTREKSWGERR